MSISRETMDLLKDDFSKLCGSRKDQAYYFELLRPMESIFSEARKKGISFSKISQALSERGVQVPTAILQEFIQTTTGEKKRVIKKKKKVLKPELVTDLETNVTSLKSSEALIG